MTDNFHKLIEVLVGPCPYVLSAVMHKYALKDTSVNFVSMPKYVTGKKRELDNLRKKGKLTETQQSMLLKSVSDESWDVSIWTTLILGFFEKKALSALEIAAVGKIRSIRNELQHQSFKTVVDNTTKFNMYWTHLETNLRLLASHCCSQDMHLHLKQELERIQSMAISSSNESVRLWYTSCMDIITQTTRKRFKPNNFHLNRLICKFIILQ